MSYTVDLIVGPVSANDKKAWEEIKVLRESYYDDAREKAPALVALHSALTVRYPCLCSYADDDPRVDESPWADGPMINNFSHEMGMLAISFSRADEVVPFIVREANALGITVADGQSGAIFRPGTERKTAKKPWWRFWQ
jgi:hypothetical protein